MKKILIIDNNKEFRDTISAILETAGFEALPVSSGYNGLIRARKEQPDLILLDIRMPSMNGMMALRKLKTDRETARIPVVIVTGAALDEQDEQEALSLGAELILEKPFRMDCFLRMVEKYILKKETDEEKREGP